jgi:cellulose synthase/poly-beta-1,6-N-acetylglucosamine synthase-like glycosyltransferase
VTCFERNDSANYGKGYGLAWAFERIPPEGFDAIVVLDADCSLDSHGLNVFDKYLSKGDRVLQASDVPSNPDESAISYAVSVGNLLENDLFYFPKSRLGMAVFLRGTGFVLHRDILKKYPWREHSNVEDVEYTVKLLRNGIGVKFISEVKAKSKFPTQKGQLNIQRTRWAGGNLSFGKKHAFKLIWQGMINKKLELLDAGWTFLVLSRPLVLFELFLSIVTVFLCVWLVPGTFSGYLLLFSVILVVLYGLYFIVGIFLLGLTCHRVGLLLGTPFVVIRLIGISLLGLLGDYKNHWARTPR